MKQEKKGWKKHPSLIFWMKKGIFKNSLQKIWKVHRITLLTSFSKASNFLSCKIEDPKPIHEIRHQRLVNLNPS